MAERLTEKHKISCFEYDLVNFEHKVKEFNDYDAFYAYNMAVRKLGKLEDIMDKYGIDNVEELDKKIAYYIDKIDLEAENDYLKKAIEKQNIVTQSISKDRDTWQKACELACEREDDCYVYDNIHRAYEFYQQAKKEGNDE